ncbi:aldehyde dehydrogenase family protein [Streptomyces rishiriensis]|uniref:Acyl-CoA reductase-like NAD-dependent aldehyde dehydrogenase n=1 Tax=Streptomyces rishiriensis TaxID=68264 RepID=A0ABU0NHN2_STRRH|nr:aldehyde dehydrogenase family protein [Streptomyces rishiriensis]MDQ0578080.1 acyl-CoA reductase-like NAD-dependent aldehyde dehydrogenase [Streptomyces rishiriensis]
MPASTASAARGLLIGGKEIPAVSGRTTDDLDPRTGEVFVRVPAAGPEDVTLAVDAADAAFASWAATAPTARRELLHRAADLLEQRADEFTQIMLAETGGTRTWAGFNIHMSATLIRQAATMATGPVGKLLASDVSGEWSMAVREPAGVVAAFVPWNGPLILCARAVAVALATGNPVIIRPSEDGPITSGYFLADILAEAGLPAGVVNIVTNDRADAPAVVEALIADPRVRRVNFTGSTPVGRIVGRLAGEHLTPVILELGGKNPIVVLDDADLQYAAAGVTVAKFMNAGQICMCVDRVIIQDSVYDAFTDAFLAKVNSLGQGNPDDPHTLVGPLINARAAERVAGLVADAVAKGATVLTGGGDADGAFYPATVLADVTADMRIYHEEVFGPVATLFRVNSAEDAVTLANDTPYGLSSAVYTENATRGLAVARALRHGAVHVNDHSVSDEPQAPVGGVKDSGFGHFGSEWGAEFFTETCWITLADQHSTYPV